MIYKTLQCTTQVSLKNERGRKREREFEGFRSVMTNAVESNQLHLNFFFFLYYKDIALSYNFLRCLTFSNFDGKNTKVHTHARTLSDPARINEAFESIRKEDLARYPVSIHTDQMFSNTFLPPAPPENLVHFYFFPITKHKLAELPYHSCTQREMRLCSAQSKVRCAQPHLFLQATLRQPEPCWLLPLLRSVTW